MYDIIGMVIIGRTYEQGYTVIKREGDIIAQEHTLAALAFPFGQEWDRLIGARSIKCLDLEHGRFAIGFWCAEKVTSQEGTLWGYCLIVNRDTLRLILWDPEPFFRGRTAELSMADFQRIVNDRLPNQSIKQPVHPQVAEAIKQLKKTDQRIIIALPDDYDIVNNHGAERFILEMVLTVCNAGWVPTFTTLTLTRSDPSQLLVIPRQHLKKLDPKREHRIEWPINALPVQKAGISANPQQTLPESVSILQIILRFCEMILARIASLLTDTRPDQSTSDQHKLGGANDKP